MPNKTYRLIYDCPDQVGLIARTTQFIASHNGCISESTQHTDVVSKRFFSRIEIQANSLNISLDDFKTAFKPIAEECRMNWKVVESTYRQKVVILASKQSHCLSDLLDRWHSNDLHCDIVAVISNHDEQRALVEHYGIAYHHVPVSKANKPQAFSEITTLIDNYSADTIVPDPGNP